MFEAGNDRHRKLMAEFYKKYVCGKSKCLMDLGKEGTLISGIRVIQNKDYSIEWHMNEYAKKMKPVNVPRGYLTNTTEVDDTVMGHVVTANGQIGWIGGIGRPDLAAGHSIIAGAYKYRKPQLVSDCNACVKQAKDHPVRLRVWPIEPKDIRFVGFL